MDTARYVWEAVFSGVVLIGSVLSTRHSGAGTAIKVIGYAIALLVPAAYLIGYNPLGLVLLPQSPFFLIVASLICIATSIYVTGYGPRRFHTSSLSIFIDAFGISMILVFASRYLLEFVVLWILAEMIGFIVIIYEYMAEGLKRSWVAGLRYLVVSMIPADLTLMTLLAVVGLDNAFSTPIDVLNVPILSTPLVTVLATIGFLAKSAIVPLHFWLPEAHSIAPAPGSALLSGLMVKMGVFGVIIVMGMGALDTAAMIFMLVILPATTIIYAGMQALAQSDIKRLLAYSTMVYTSLIVMSLASYRLMGSEWFLFAAYYLIAAHAAYKATLFLDAGTVEVVAGTRLLERLGWVSKALPEASVLALLAVMSLMGVPPTIGFLAKLWLFLGGLDSVLVSNYGALVLAVIAIGAALSLGYGARYLLAHWGSTKPERRVVIGTAMRYMLAGEALAASLSLVFPMIMDFISPTGVVIGAQYSIVLSITALILAVSLAGLYFMESRARREAPWVGGAA